MVSVTREPGKPDAFSADWLQCLLEQTGIFGKAPVMLIAIRAGIRMPVMQIAPQWRLNPFVRWAAGVGGDLASRHELSEPGKFVRLRVVGIVSGRNDKLQRCTGLRTALDPVERADDHFGGMQRQCFLRTAGGKYQMQNVRPPIELLHEFEAPGRLGVD